MTLSKQLDEHLIGLAWSLWNELGVAGIKRNHQQYLIVPEELIVLTAVIAEGDPRLRDEALDWCSRYHQYISTSRLKTIAKAFGESASRAFSIFAATLNSMSNAKWPLFTSELPLKFTTSGKSKLATFELPALLCFRLRALFGIGARADLMMFFLAEKKSDIAAVDATEIGYAKRSLVYTLEDFVRAGIIETFMSRNQRRYRFAKRDQMIMILGALPKFMPSWRLILEVILELRSTIQHVEGKSDSTKTVEIRNTLIDLQVKLEKLKLQPPPMKADVHAYWNSFAEWILGLVESLEQGKSTEI